MKWDLATGFRPYHASGSATSQSSAHHSLAVNAQQKSLFGQICRVIMDRAFQVVLAKWVHMQGERIGTGSGSAALTTAVLARIRRQCCFLSFIGGYIVRKSCVSCILPYLDH